MDQFSLLLDDDYVSCLSLCLGTAKRLPADGRQPAVDKNVRCKLIVGCEVIALACSGEGRQYDDREIFLITRDDLLLRYTMDSFAIEMHRCPQD